MNNFIKNLKSLVNKSYFKYLIISIAFLIWITFLDSNSLLIHDELNQEINFDMIITQTYDIFLPMLLGGAILAIPVWLTTYLLTHSFVSSYKKSKIKKNKILKR